MQYKQLEKFKNNLKEETSNFTILIYKKIYIWK